VPTRYSAFCTCVRFLHGNGGNLESWSSGTDYYQRVNYDMFMFDYRGYGMSTGHNDIHQFKSYIDGLIAELPGS
jgi:pimeloyl-ACP methyl ester carboxylesterase